jgi:hypothetical protein
VPTDLVPRGDWSYDVLASVARKGLLPGVSVRSLRGDELRTRGEVADLIVRAAQASDELPEGLRAMLGHLAREYRQELGARAGDLEQRLASSGQGAVVTGYFLGRLATDGDASALGIYRVGGALSLNRYLVATASGTDDRRLWSERPDAFTDLERATLRLDTRYVRWELGKRDEYWGPGYGGAMLVSDNAPGYLALRGEALLKLGFLGNWSLVQTVGTFTEAGGRKYVVARRLSRTIERRWGLSFAEAVKTNTSREGYFALFLPLYAYGKIVDESVRNSNSLNYLSNVSLTYNAGRRGTVYGDLFLDDITAPFGLGPVDVARKLGFLVGARIRLVPGSDRTELRIEYTLTDGDDPDFAPEGGAYFHRNPDLAWFHDGLTMGHRMSRNRRGPFLRVRHRVNERITGIAEWEHETQFRRTPAVGDRRRITLYGAYDLRPDRSVALRVDRLRGALGDDTVVAVQGSIGF